MLFKQGRLLLISLARLATSHQRLFVDGHEKSIDPASSFHYAFRREHKENTLC